MLIPDTNQIYTTGDIRVLDAARQQIRQGFRENATLPPSDPQIQPALKHAEEVAHFLRTNLVQGKKEGDRYGEESLFHASIRFPVC